MVNYYNEYKQSGYDQSLYKTKSEMAALMNITEEQLDQLIRGQIKYIEYEYESYGSLFCMLIPLYSCRLGFVGGGDGEYYDVHFSLGTTADAAKLDINETSDGMFYIASIKFSNWN